MYELTERPQGLNVHSQIQDNRSEVHCCDVVSYRYRASSAKALSNDIAVEEMGRGLTDRTAIKEHCALVPPVQLDEEDHHR